ncbi:hypothetical protein PHLGIDRAFT_106723 [Phlebiopsis gigantea 11061_1 CR5-6]|uniref:Peptide hydrolase n=1 Tax=Phlebiopsis gigantea (strain 11061_1 CR5-6) TaxID=745531 RepID=A0A0C3S789_PHLG1|nr:hypothetical protein PHLGIDRAFT_106723 [Phlebiopsis gigantea 11061_1 CR5-6]
MLATTLAPFILLVSKQLPAPTQPHPCLSYHGLSTSGKYSFFGTVDETCITDAVPLLESGSFVAVDYNSRSELVWLESEAEGIDESLRSKSLDSYDAVALFLQSVKSSLVVDYAAQKQHTISEEPSADVLQVLHQDAGSVLLRVDRSLAKSIDTHLPPFWRSMTISREPQQLLPVPTSAVDRVREILKQTKFDPTVASLVNNISVTDLKNDIRYLTGEDPKSNILSRHSFSDGVRVAAHWLKGLFEHTGATCELSPFLSGFAPNVICSYPATVNTTETILVSAHYDSRGSFGTTRAPGGDDDGSGTVALISIARAIARTGVTFKKNIQLCAFAGEEQGLLGSRAYAREMREKGADLTLMVQADMLAYHKAGEPPQLGLPEVIGTPEVTQLVANLSAIYSPELTVGFTAACCSDHQSFHEQGFPATQVFERAGPIVDPMYHNSGDLSDREGYDFEQLRSIAKFATLLHAAGYDVPESAQ